MFFDLTQEITLQGKILRLYSWLRFCLFILSVAAAVYLSFLILFPSKYFYFDFTNYSSPNNSIISPRNQFDTPLSNGRLDASSNLIFDAANSDVFPEALATFSLDSKLAHPISGNLTIQKTYRALFYPEDKPIGFKDGTLLKSGGDHFIVSDGYLRKFSNAALANLGFSDSQFTSVEASDLKYNPIGEFIEKNDTYTNNSLFKINDVFYIFYNNKLRPFTSKNAYNSQYDEKFAIIKDADFLSQYPIDTDPIGYADGSLISYANSVFIVSEGNILPIDNPQTFISAGYDWADVISASADEISLYTKTKLFNKNSPHPNGTIFSATDKTAWFIIKNNHKIAIPSEKILTSWLKKKPILFATNSKSQCILEKTSYFYQNDIYTCTIPLTDKGNTLGNDFHFTLESNENISLSKMDITFKKNVNQNNFKTSIGSLYNKIISNYYAPVQ